MTTPLLTLVLLCATMVGTSFLSGIFGMAGGLVLVGVLLALMPVPEAMALHAALHNRGPHLGPFVLPPHLREEAR